MGATTDMRPPRDARRGAPGGPASRDAGRGTLSARPRRRRPGPGPVVAASLALFLTLFALLAWQMRNGRDPALGAGTATAPAQRPPHVVVHRVVRRIVIVHAPAQAPVGSAPPAGAAPAASAPVPPAPAAPAPSPAPPPAPVVTRAS